MKIAVANNVRTITAYNVLITLRYVKNVMIIKFRTLKVHASIVVLLIAKHALLLIRLSVILAKMALENLEVIPVNVLLVPIQTAKTALLT